MGINLPAGMRKTITFRNGGVGDYVQGVWVPGPPADDINLEASVQELNSKELLLLPEGRRTRSSKKMYTNIELSTINETTLKQAGMVFYDGRDWEIHSVKPYDMGLADHFKIIAVEVTK